MAIYDFREEPPRNREEGEKPLLYPRIVSSGTITTEQLAKEIARSTTFTQGEVKGMIVTLADVLARHLNNGYRVKLGEIGYFSARLSARPVTDKREITSRSIRIDDVNFKATAAFRRHLNGEVQRAKGDGFRRSSTLPVEKKKELLLEWLREKRFISRKTYCALTHTLKTKAWKELNGFVEEGIIRRTGHGNQLLYILPE